MSEQNLTAADFADLFGAEATGLPVEIQMEIEARNWRYRPLNSAERDHAILGLLRRVEAKQFSIVQNRDKSRWEKGWGENLAALQASGGDLESLSPKYWRPNQPLRLRGDFVQPRDADFEPAWFKVFTRWFFSTYLQGFDHIFEFGSGSGINIPTLATMFGEARICGLDWARAAVEIVDSLQQHFGPRVTGRSFDFFDPDYDLDIPDNSAVITIGAIEQTASEFQPFLDFLLAKKPRRVLHIEPIVEWYDPNNLVDYTGILTQTVRNFMKGYPDALDALEGRGVIRVLKRKRTHFGSLAHEGYSQLIWEPVRVGNKECGP